MSFRRWISVIFFLCRAGSMVSYLYPAPKATLGVGRSFEEGLEGFGGAYSGSPV